MCYIVVPDRAFDLFMAGRNSFGQLVRSLYHEHLHVKQRIGWKGANIIYYQSEREFLAYYASITNTTLPNTTEYERKIMIITAYEKQYHAVFTETQKQKYKKEIDYLTQLYNKIKEDEKPKENKPKKGF
jgi:hypothetical protein